jgi:hypothetical protein
MSSYEVWEREVLAPLCEKLKLAISPVLRESEHLVCLEEEYKQLLINHVADRCGANVLSQFQRFVQKQEFHKAQKLLDENKLIKALEFEQRANISKAEFRAMVLAEMDSIVKDRNEENGVVLDGYNCDIFTELVNYFYPASETKLNRKKGILLMADSGVGKSTMMEGFRDNPLASFVCVNCSEFVENWQHNPEFAMNKVLSGKTKAEDGYVNWFGHSEFEVFFDEFGRENKGVLPKGESYKSNTVNVMQQVIMRLHEQRGVRVHLATNATEEDLVADYGVFVYSKMKDLFNIIKWSDDAPDRRFL